MATRSVNLGQSLKESGMIHDMLAGSVTDFKKEQSMKAHCPIFVTPLGITTDFNDLQFLKAESAITVTPDGIVYFSLVLPAGYVIISFLYFVIRTPSIEQ